MKDAHLTLRLSDALARALSRVARTRGVPKSLVAREAVALYLAPATGVPAERIVHARDVASRWGALPRLTAAEADDLAEELRRAREALPAPSASWE